MTTRCGLTLGKYAPLHRGHQHVIETALTEMDEVCVVIYDAPDITSISLDVRSNWITVLYPEVRLIKAYNGPVEVGYTKSIMKSHEDYLLNVLRIQGITHFYSSEPYGHHVSKALGAVNRPVDLARIRFPVSGTVIRQDPFRYREYLAPVVYRDLVIKIAILGAPSTGKTTLASKLAREMRTGWMQEYGREYWERHQKDRRLSMDQLVEIAETHLQLEDDQLLMADRFLFSDTNALTTRIFGLYYHSRTDPRLERLADLAVGRYDIIFLCDTDIPYDDSWDRSGEVNRQEFQEMIIDDLEERGLSWFLVQGDIEERVRQVKDILAGHRKFQVMAGPHGPG